MRVSEKASYALECMHLNECSTYLQMGLCLSPEHMYFAYLCLYVQRVSFHVSNACVLVYVI